jgi:membrane-bound lytic murein transglycosylase F
MGYQYDLLHELSEALEMDLEIIVENDLSQSFSMLEDGRCDLLALNLTVTKERSQFLKFTVPHTTSRQVLVQRRPEKWWTMHPERLEGTMLRNQLDLAGKTVYVQQNSSFASRLHSLSEEIGDSIHIVEVEEPLEKLISMVAKGEIDYTISDENMARVNQTFHRNIDIATAVSFPQNLAWAVRKEGSDQWLGTVNSWLIDFKRTTRYALIYNKYFKNSRTGIMAESGMIYQENDVLSEYDQILKKYSDTLQWDWRLLASMVYQESRFYPDTVSWVGAFGLMQLMPATARRYGVSKNSPPEKNVEAGVNYLMWLDDVLSDQITDSSERLKFVLASYNVGLGHVLDARRLARKYGKDSNIWEGHVDEFILKKSNPEYYLDPVVSFGYCRGEEAYNFVREILNRYEHYKNIIALN